MPSRVFPDPPGMDVMRFAAESKFGQFGRLGMALLALAATSASAQDDSPLAPNQTAAEYDLAALIAIAEGNSPALRQAAAEVNAARGRAHQAGLYPNPTLNGGAMQLGGVDSQYFAQLSQEIVTKHKLQLDQAAACREVFQAEYQFVKTRFELLTAVRQGYFTVLAGQQRVDTLSKLVSIARKSEDAAARLQAAGEGTRSDTLLFQLEVEKAEVDLQNAETLLAAARRELAASMGVRTWPIARVTGDLRISLEAFAAQTVVDGYVPYNADVMIAEQEVERQRILLRRARVEPFPNVTVTAGYMRQLLSTNNITLLEAAVPLPVWNKNQGNIFAAQAGVTRAMENIHTVQNQLARQMADAQGRFRAADQLVARYEQRIIPLAREGVEIIQQAFDQGQFDFLRLLQAQRALVEAQLGYLSALETRWTTAAEIAGLAQVEVFP
uniref:TolC family protein n=1 Tax=Schlesneria paludicola TaxID=360056 RepID=A0A7C4QI65_9PLAN